ncbi:hypothetical protein AAO05_10085 [Salmonella enterica subsp. enterica serovar Infantis]|nr:hypothetical protein [Salmonella enterica subsp. enterica serovar Infantis]
MDEEEINFNWSDKIEPLPEPPPELPEEPPEGGGVTVVPPPVLPESPGLSGLSDGLLSVLTEGGTPGLT